MSIEKLSDWDWPDYLLDHDGYDHKRVPEATSKNISLMAEKINEIIDALDADGDRQNES